MQSGDQSQLGEVIQAGHFGQTIATRLSRVYYGRAGHASASCDCSSSAIHVILFIVDTHMQVAAKAQEDDLPFHRYKTQAIVEVMVDLLLDAEGVTVHEGLVFVLDEGLESYPVSGI